MAKKAIIKVRVEGNKGGTYIDIRDTEVDGIVTLEVGDSCVVMIKERRVRVTDVARALISADAAGRLTERAAEGDVYDYLKGDGY